MLLLDFAYPIALFFSHCRSMLIIDFKSLSLDTQLKVYLKWFCFTSY